MEEFETRQLHIQLVTCDHRLNKGNKGNSAEVLYQFKVRLSLTSLTKIQQFIISQEDIKNH